MLQEQSPMATASPLAGPFHTLSLPSLPPVLSSLPTLCHRRRMAEFGCNLEKYSCR